MFEKFALYFGKVYPYIWPVAFIVMGIVAINEPHMHFTLFGVNLDSHNLIWFMMGLAHADIFWRGWCARHGSAS